MQGGRRLKTKKLEGKVLAAILIYTVCSSYFGGPVCAANSGGISDKPNNGDYTGAYVEAGTAGTAENATVIIDSNVQTAASGGYNAGSGDAKNNQITVNSGTIGVHVYGGYAADGSASYNKVTFNGGANNGSGYGGNVFGGESKNADAVTNHVILQGGTVTDVYGGKAGSNGQAAWNKVVVDGVSSAGEICGGVGESSVSGNQVVVSSGTIKAASGGSNIKGSTGEVSQNQVLVTGGTVTEDVWGGKALNSSGTVAVSGNSVTVRGGSMRNIYGGNNSGNGIAANNTVSVSGTSVQISGDVIGGYAAKGSAANNSVLLENVQIGKTVYGGYVGGSNAQGSATGNSVVLTGDTDVQGTSISGRLVAVCGGLINALNVQGNADANTVILAGAIAANGNVYGGWARAAQENASNNTLIIGEDASIKGDMYGGSCVSGAASDNFLKLTGNATVSGDVLLGCTSTGTADNNVFELDGNAVVGGAVYGGYCSSSSASADSNTLKFSGNAAVKGDVFGGLISAGTASGNTIVIDEQAQLSGDICGGYSGSTDAVNNTITVGGAPVFGDKTILYGGLAGSNGFAGNTLNIKTTDLAVANAVNFEYYNFDLQRVKSIDDVLLTLTDADSSGTDLSGSKVAVQGRLNGVLNIGNNDKLVLLANHNAEITTDVNTELQSGEIMQGVSVIYDYTAKMSDDNKQVLAEFTNGRVSVNSQSPVETRLAAAAFLNSGADLLADKGIADIAEIADDSIFGVMSGGSMRYDTGSHADVKGYNLAMGFGKIVTNNAGQLLTFGSFIEYGYGNYTSHFDSGIRADGNTKYYGIGLLARQDNNDGVYYESSLRYGRMDADYASGDLIGAGGSKVFADYDSSSSYYGAHLGIGKVNKINDTTKADLYAKLFYTHQGGDSVTLGGEGNGEVYDFDAVDSTRARVGARLSKDYGERSSGYVGLAYEYEFDGEARATVKGLSTPAPSIKGSNGLLEVGYILQPKGVNDPMINIGLQGWGGKKQGFTGNVNFVWKF
jgi:hypothetical protein